MVEHYEKQHPINKFQAAFLERDLASGRLGVEEFIADPGYGGSHADRVNFAYRKLIDKPGYYPEAETPIKKFGITIPGVANVDGKLQQKLHKTDLDRKLLHGAAKSGDVAALKEALRLADDPTLTDKNGQNIDDLTKDNPEANYLSKQAVYEHREKMGPAEGQDPNQFREEQSQLLGDIREAGRQQTLAEHPEIGQSLEQDLDQAQDLGQDLGDSGREMG